MLRVVIAGIRAGSATSLSAPVGLPAGVRRALADQGVEVFVESDEEWLERITHPGDPEDPLLAQSAGTVAAPSRVRLIGPRDSVGALRRWLSSAVGGDPDLAIFDGDATTAGRLELLPFLREQSVTITAHRFGHPDPWSEDVI